MSIDKGLNHFLAYHCESIDGVRTQIDHCISSSLRKEYYKAIDSGNKQRIFKVLETARQVYESRSRRIPTSELNDRLLPIVKEQNPPPSVKGKWVKIKYITQLPTHYPQFVFFCNLPQYVRDPYKRFVENRIREMWDFHGVPISIFFRAK